MTAPLTFGAPITIHPDADPLDDLRWADAHAEVDTAWMIDHLQGWYPRGTSSPVLEDPHHTAEPLTVLAAGAATTRRVSLGVAVTDPLRRTSVNLAHTAGTISRLAGRRLALGIGAGDPGQLRPFGLHQGTERTGRLHYIRPALEQLHALRTAESPWPDADLPAAHRDGYDLYIAAHGPRMLALTARYGDGWIPSSIGPADYARKLSLLRQQAEQAGRDPHAVKPLLFLWTALAGTRKESRALLDHPTVRAVALYRGKAAFDAAGARYPLAHGYIPHEVPAGDADTLLRGIPDEIVEQAVLHGSPDDVRRRLDEYHRAGCEHVILYDVGRFAETGGTERFREAFTAVATQH
ncbi:phthiodiolone/phenolphthiodiolone dimycocerosates ketoreductase [Nocardia transvalensis]|uniref:Phthiodiolone/phenolphthiodiolone dimycocerosates ketoreductase n=1 Tax=Nocardia transvalensis TaxID=37333 RepID=A0A7W9UJT1_9NOCA|nr:LLM class flavin-dependent oxidoreductase [Nocardia transvalensis]MBB5915676.1 phthiodiolone/phenolphthiodiolone dimycocerosates ketoreductase [Nocardia transvalensis]